MSPAMQPDSFQDSLSKLGDKYQVLTELHHCADSATYLARNLQLNRDVTITVARANGDKAFLNAYAADAEQLKTKRHPNIVPVLEGIWLDDATFAVVRARVRGSTLDQTISADGPIPQPRIAAALNELTSALIWARENGITNRCVEAETFVFQQGSGRLLLAFEPSHLIAGDAETIESFARMMNGGAPVDVSEYTARLGEPSVTSTPARQATAPVGGDVAVVERPHRGMSFVARVLTTFGVIAAVTVGALWYMQHRRSDARAQANAQRASQDAGGDVSPHNALDTAAAYSSITPTVPPPPPPNLDSIGRENEKRIAQAKAEQAMPSPYGSYVSPYSTPPTSYPSSSSSSLYPPAPSSSITTSTRPPATTRPTTPSPADSLTLPRRDSAGRTELLDPCGSPISSDQGQCLNSAIDRADRSVNGVYQRLIDALRRQAGVSAADPDPSTVEDLRASQRNWLRERDDACKSVGEGSSFYARERGSCYVERSSSRKAELQRQLDSVP
jgi:uncharacterized protein YecT (DUF1311 family)